MGVHVDGPNALSVDHDLASSLRRLRKRGAHQTASDKRKTRQCASSRPEHFSTIHRHLHFPRSN